MTPLQLDRSTEKIINIPFDIGRKNKQLFFIYRLVNAKNLIDLLKIYGPNEESLLMTFCCQKNDSTFLRAQVFAFLSRVLSESNQDAIQMIIKKNQVGLSALDYATMANNAKIAAFLANLFYIFGQDVLGKDTEVSVYLSKDLKIYL